MNSESTVSLIRRAEQDPDAKLELFNRLKDDLEVRLNRLRKKFPGAKATEETTADFNHAWAKIDERLERYTDRDHLLASYYTIVKHMLIDRLRRNQRQAKPFADLNPPTQREKGPEDSDDKSRFDPENQEKDWRNITRPGAGTIAEKAEDKLLYLECVDAVLVEDDLDLYIPIVWWGQKQNVVFDDLGIPESTGRARLARIRVKIEREVKRRDPNRNA